MKTEICDLLVLGGGAAGLAAARAARRLDAHVVMVQAGPVGGDCTFTGCVPSKTLLSCAASGMSLAEAMRRVHDTVAEVARTETAEVLRAEGVEVVEGTGRFVGPRTLEVTGRLLRAPAVVIATGSDPVLPSFPGLRREQVLTTDDLWHSEGSLDPIAVVGGGPAGCELAQALARFGVAVSLLEQAPRLLPDAPVSAAAVVETALRRDGVDVRTGTTVVEARSERGSLLLSLSDGSSVRADRVLAAMGRRARTQGLGLAAAGVRVGADGEIETDDRTATSARGVRAAGDVTGRFASTAAADESGRTAAVNALRRAARLRVHEDALPRVVYTDPEVAWVGVWPQGAPSGARVAHQPMTEVDRARTDARTEGHLSLVAMPRRGLGRRLGWIGGGRLVGSVVVCPHAGELIGELTLAIRTRMFLGRLAQTIHPYPAYSTAIRTAAATLVFDHDLDHDHDDGGGS